jgi:hypothetical protein
VIVDEPLARIAFLWSWTTSRWVEVASTIAAGRDWELERSPILSRQPTTVRISLRREGKVATAVELEHFDVPVELASMVQPFWDWALRRALPDCVTRSPFYGSPWDRA